MQSDSGTVIDQTIIAALCSFSESSSEFHVYLGSMFCWEKQEQQQIHSHVGVSKHHCVVFLLMCTNIFVCHDIRGV